MHIQDIMSKEVHVAEPETSVKDVASIMADKGVGIVPIHNQDRLVGMVTDRDIVVSVVAKGLDTTEPVKTAMCKEVLYCRTSDDAEDIARNMADNAVRRLPVVDDDKRLVGMVTLADIAEKANSTTAGEALRTISVSTEPKAA